MPVGVLRAGKHVMHHVSERSYPLGRCHTSSYLFDMLILHKNPGELGGFDIKVFK